ncbi:protein kinase family protein [Parasphingorhabdus pacifica]
MSSKPSKQVSDSHESGVVNEDPPEHGLTPGAVLDHGRYRLLAPVGIDSRCDAHLWRAKDGVLGRDVALTILVGDRADSEAAGNARRTLERAMHASTFNHVGVARVLDVVTPASGDPHGILGVVIAEWTHGTDLTDLVADGPLPPGSASRLMQPLAAAVEAAHHAGLVLGADHPQRIRVTPEGEIRMAFPGPLARSTSSDDVRGLGSALYLLLTGRWALDGGPEGLSVAPTGPDGTVVAPRTLRPSVPLELSTVAVRALGNPDSNGTHGGVRTGAAVLRVLEQHATVEADTTVMQSAPAGAGSGDTEVWSRDDPKPDQTRRKKLMISAGVLALATLLVVSWMTANLIGIFTGTSETDEPPLTIDDGDNEQTGQPAQQPPEPTTPVGIAGGEAVNQNGKPDSPHRVKYLFDGDKGTYWTTAGYFQQVGPNGITTGTGARLSLKAPTVVREVVIDSPSPGTQVEIRAAEGAGTAPESAPVIGSATLTNGTTTVPVNGRDPSSHLIVYLTKLTPQGGKFESQINEITVRGVAG